MSKRHLYMQLTNKCDQQCAHCAFNCGPWNSDFMSDEVVDACMGILKTKKFGSVTLGGGEPTLYPGLFDLVLRIRQECNIPVGMVTNGTGDPELVKELIRYSEATGNFSLEISADNFHARPSSELLTLVDSVKPWVASFRMPDDEWLPYAQGRAKILPHTSSKLGCTGGTYVSAQGYVFPCSCGLSYYQECDNKITVTEWMENGPSEHSPFCIETPWEYNEWVNYRFNKKGNTND